MGLPRKIFPAETFICSKCGQEGPAEIFRQSRPGYFFSTCRPCRQAQNRENMRRYGRRKQTKIGRPGEYDFVFSEDIRKWH